MDEIDGVKGEEVRVAVGSRVSIRDVETGEIMEFTVVTPEMADPSTGKFSMGCPLVVGIAGHGAGEAVKVQLRDGVRTFKILSVVSPSAKSD